MIGHITFWCNNTLAFGGAQVSGKSTIVSAKAAAPYVYIRERSHLIMAYIYQIVNDINNKIYIGKTNLDIEIRFKQHCKDAQKSTEEHRPLYAAMHKYGIEHFHIELIEETDNPEEREIYWIEQKGSFKNGYNATKGGDGKPYADYDLIYNLWKNEGLTIRQIQKITSYAQRTIETALRNHNVSIEESKARGHECRQKAVLMLDKNTEKPIKAFPSIKSAAEYLGNPSIANHIPTVCKGKRQTAGGYRWKYID